ncbi:MAG: site-specific integrase [Firmicutes bacterium]|nr:site-specific integrase [Bacillota bacterium]
MKIKNASDFSNMTFKDLIEEHYNYQLDKVKVTTLKNYENMRPYFVNIENIKLEDFNIRHYEMWRQHINSKSISTRYKNTLYKYLKALMNFGAKWYDINFLKVYNKMSNFTNPNERRKEMSYYNYEEFKKFISYEDDLRWKCVFEIFYYCGLRKGELKGLTWKDIYFDKKVLSVNKQITQLNNRTTFEFSDTKTKDSYRIVPITKVLLNDLKMLYEQSKKEYYNFNDDFFVASDARPIADSTIYDRRTKLAEAANLKSIRLHDFRHSCASLLINNGANVTLVAKFLGHTKIEETLNTYSHMFSTALDNVVSIIDSLEDN